MHDLPSGVAFVPQNSLGNVGELNYHRGEGQHPDSQGQGTGRKQECLLPCPGLTLAGAFVLHGVSRPTQH